MTQAEQFRKYHAKVEYINGWKQETINAIPDAERLSYENQRGWRFSDGSELWEGDHDLFTHEPDDKVAPTPEDANKGATWNSTNSNISPLTT